MSEKIADFSLNHAGTTYTRNEAGQVVSYINFEGEVSAYGGVFGTLSIVENFTIGTSIRLVFWIVPQVESTSSQKKSQKSDF